MHSAQYGGMALIRLYILIGLLGGEVMGGWAPRYDPGVMERVSFNRDLPIVSCMVSSPYYDIGEMVYVYGRNTGAVRWCRVTDVSKPEHRARHRRIGWIIEAGYNEALSLCGAEHINDPPRSCPVLVFRLKGDL